MARRDRARPSWPERNPRDDPRACPRRLPVRRRSTRPDALADRTLVPGERALRRRRAPATRRRADAGVHDSLALSRRQLRRSRAADLLRRRPTPGYRLRPDRRPRQLAAHRPGAGRPRDRLRRARPAARRRRGARCSSIWAAHYAASTAGSRASTGSGSRNAPGRRGPSTPASAARLRKLRRVAAAAHPRAGDHAGRMAAAGPRSARVPARRTRSPGRGVQPGRRPDAVRRPT